jgi:hypothetical protein
VSLWRDHGVHQYIPGLERNPWNELQVEGEPYPSGPVESPKHPVVPAAASPETPPRFVERHSWHEKQHPLLIEREQLAGAVELFGVWSDYVTPANL